MFANSYSGLFFIWLIVFVITCWDMLQGLLWAGLCRMIYCTARGPLLTLAICVGVQWVTFLSGNLDDAAFNWAFSCSLLTDSVWGRGDLYHWRKWLVVNADRSTPPLGKCSFNCKYFCRNASVPSDFWWKSGNVSHLIRLILTFQFNYKNEILSLYGMKCDYFILWRNFRNFPWKEEFWLTCILW